MQNDEMDLKPLLRPIKNHPKLVFVFVFIGALLALGYTVWVKPTWEIKAALLLPLESQGGNPLAGLLKGSADPLEMMKGVLQSETSEEYLAKRSGLEPREIDRKLNVETQKDQNQVIISVVDSNENLARQIVSDAIVELRNLSQEGNMSLNEMQAKSLEKDVAARTTRLNALEDRLKEYTTHTAAPIDPTNPFDSSLRAKKKEADYELAMINRQIDTALSVANQMGKQSLSLPTAIPNQETLRERLVSQQYQLDTAQTTLGEANPQVKALEAQIAITKNLITGEVAKYLTAANKGLDPNLAQLFGQRVLLQFQQSYLTALANKAPDEALTAARLYQELLMEQDGLKAARIELEQAKLGELVDPLQWSVISPPYKDPKPKNKRWAIYPLAGMFLGLMLGTGIAALMDRSKQKREGKAAARRAASEAKYSDES